MTFQVQRQSWGVCSLEGRLRTGLSQCLYGMEGPLSCSLKQPPGLSDSERNVARPRKPLLDASHGRLRRRCGYRGGDICDTGVINGVIRQLIDGS